MYFDTVQMAQKNSCEMQALGRATTVLFIALKLQLDICNERTTKSSNVSVTLSKYNVKM